MALIAGNHGQRGAYEHRYRKRHLLAIEQCHRAVPRNITARSDKWPDTATAGSTGGCHYTRGKVDTTAQCIAEICDDNWDICRIVVLYYDSIGQL